jgi:hypothetical protein
VVQTTSAVFTTEMRISSFAALRICAGTFTLCAKCEMILGSKLATLMGIERESSVARVTIGLDRMVGGLGGLIQYKVEAWVVASEGRK